MFDFFINSAWANASSAPQGMGLANIVMLLVFFAIFYFILIRPQIKQNKQHKELVASLSKGDEIVTSGGLLGKIKEVGDDFVMIEIANGVEVRQQRQAVSIVMPKGTIKSL